jgi:hypothetical protein
MKGTCSGCAYFSETALKKGDKDLVKELVGRGTLLFMGEVEPALIIAGAAATLVLRIDLKRPEQAPSASAEKPKQARKKKTYTTAAAICSVVSEKKPSLPDGLIHQF